MVTDSTKRWTLGTLLKYALITSVTILDSVSSHGRLSEPPSRSTMWRFGFKTPPNYQDHELFCGGLTRMNKNGGKCGICGDPADARQPRANEAGGKYANGVIVRQYKANQEVDTLVELTAHHKGYFEFKLCPTNNPKVDPTQECFDKHAMTLVSDPNQPRNYVPTMIPDGNYRMKYLLPKGLTCTFCVMQWTYVAGNNWGTCANGTEKMGCGPQETFRACADVSISGTGNDGSGQASNDIETNDIEGSSLDSSAPSSVPAQRYYVIFAGVTILLTKLLYFS